MVKIVNICDVCTEIFAGGDAPKGRISKERTEEYPIPIYSNGEEKAGLYGFTDVARVEKPSVTVSARGTIGYSAIRTEPFVPIVRLITLIPDKSKIDIKYLYYAVQNYEFEGSGTSIPQLTVPMLKKYNFPLPPMEEQQDIVSALDKVTELLALRKEQIAKLDQLVKSRFIELFCDCQKQTNIKESGLTISDGNYSSKYPRSEEFVESGIPFIRANNLKNGTVVDEDMYFITPQKHAILLKGHLKPNDVLITTRGNIGQVAIVPNKHNDSNINAQIVLLRDDNNRFVPQYLLWALQTEEAKSQYIELQTGTALKQLPVGRLEQVVIKEPPIELQKQFATFVEQTDKSKLAIQQSLDKLELLKKSLMQEYFG